MTRVLFLVALTGAALAVSAVRGIAAAGRCAAARQPSA